MQRRAFLAFMVILLLTIGMLAVLSMLANSVTVESHFSLEAYRELLASRHQWTLMGHSMALSFMVTVLTTAAGVPLGILLGKTDLPFRRLFIVLFVIPLLIPPYITAVSWFDLIGREGLLAQLIGPSFAKTTAHLLFGLPGCVAVLFSALLSIPMLLTTIFFRTVFNGLFKISCCT